MDEAQAIRLRAVLAATVPYKKLNTGNTIMFPPKPVMACIVKAKKDTKLTISSLIMTITHYCCGSQIVFQLQFLFFKKFLIYRISDVRKIPACPYSWIRQINIYNPLYACSPLSQYDYPAA